MLLRFVAESIRRSPQRKAMIIAAVALGSAVATSITAVILDIGDRVNRELRGLGANLAVTAREQSLPVEIGGIRYRPLANQSYIPEALVPRIKAIFWHPNIIGFAPSLHSSTRINNHIVAVEGAWFLRRFRSPDGKWLETGLHPINSAWRVDGAWIDDRERDERDNRCMMGAALARRLGAAPASKIPLFGETFTVAGVISGGGDEDDRVFVRLEVLQRLTHRPAQVDSISVSALTKPEDEFARKDPSKMSPAEHDRWYCTPYLSSIAHQIQEVLPMAVAKPVWRVADNEGRVLGKVRTLMLVIACTALIAASLTVGSVMAAAVLERRGEIAIMQATGASNWLIATLFSIEVALQGLAGGLIGVLIGSELAHWVGRSVFQKSPGISPMLPPFIILLAGVIAVAGAAPPLARALSMPPVIALRQEA